MTDENSKSDQDTELTMCDVLEEEQELEDDANAVLGGSDDTNCSYDKGYVPRQALYACTTCCKEGNAGVCLACCYACHDGHEVVELYTKRNFRCDCGNSKFNGKTCSLRPEKDPVNLKNNYNQNFKGLYCKCSRPYPDLEDTVPDEMIQCVICEDWYHGRHLGVDVPEDYFEMICFKCMDSRKFLFSYLNHRNMQVDRKTSTVKDASITSNCEPVCLVKKEEEDVTEPNFKLETGDMAELQTRQTDVLGNEMEILSDSAQNKEEIGDAVNGKVSDPNLKLEIAASVDDVNPSQPVSFIKNEASDIKENTRLTNSSLHFKPESNESSFNSSPCVLKSIDADTDVTSGSAFWPENWRKELCHCPNCLSMYRDLECQFLLDPEDTIHAYEERGKGVSKESQYDQGLSALSRLDRVKQMEAVRAYTSMKGQLKAYLKDFADNKRTVGEGDIKEFFERITKKQKLNNSVPHYCR